MRLSRTELSYHLELKNLKSIRTAGIMKLVEIIVLHSAFLASQDSVTCFPWDTVVNPPARCARHWSLSDKKYPFLVRHGVTEAHLCYQTSASLAGLCGAMN